MLPSPWKETVAAFQGSLDASFKGKRIAWAGNFKSYTPYEPGVLDVCKSALKVFESTGCTVDETGSRITLLDAVWQAVLRIRGWQQGGAIFGFYNYRAKRALLKPEAIYEIELGLKQSAYDITAASVVRSEWYQAVRRMFEKYDYFIVPTAQLFPFDAEIHWPQEIAG